MIVKIPILKSTSIFLKNFEKLVQHYPSLKKDLAEEFKNFDIDVIFAKKYVLKDSGMVKILKVRIANSEQNKGKSAGFRIILIVDKRKNELVFLTIFAKTGTLGRENIDKEELKDCLVIYKDEHKNNLLIDLDPKKHFDII